MYVAPKEQGRGNQKCQWGIEMNNACYFYLITYNAIDQMDHLIQNRQIKNKACKYWYSPVNHALAMGVVVSYDVYKEITKSDLNPDWKVDKPFDFFTFHETLA